MPHLVAALDFLGVVMTVLGLGALIFFHELGHFIACRLTGTRVEAFSIGFGPEIFGWRRGPTRYRVAAIPLGGYVKMAAENPGEERSDAPDEFPNKSFGQRLFIMSNGVVFNVILALALYIVAFRVGVAFPKAQFGRVEQGGPAWEAGLLAGDVVTKVNGRPILGFDDLRTEIAFSDQDELLKLTVRRADRELEIQVRPRYSELSGMPVIQVSGAFDQEMKGVIAESPLERAGGRAGDVFLAIDDEPAGSVHDASRILSRAVGRAPAGSREITVRLRMRRKSGETVELPTTVQIEPKPQLGIQPHAGNTVTRIASAAPAAKWLKVGDTVLGVNGRAVADLRAYGDQISGSAQVKRIDVMRGAKRITVVPDGPLTERALADSVAGDTDLGSTRVAPRAGMPAARAGMLAGDRMLKVGSTPVTSWTELHEAVRTAGMGPVKVVVERDQKTLELTIEPVGVARYALAGYEPGNLRTHHRETNILSAVKMGWFRTTLAMKSVALTIRSLITRRVSARHIGGPITLAQATYGMLEEGWGRYLYILALISINLAILNILPIPVLDGGQIVLLCAEKLRGRPLPDKLVGYFQMVGLLMILSLLVLAFRNDIVRLLN